MHNVCYESHKRVQVLECYAYLHTICYTVMSDVPFPLRFLRGHTATDTVGISQTGPPP